MVAINGTRTVLEACLAAHAKAAMRENASTHILRGAYFGSQSKTQAIAAALLSTGGAHAPLEQTYAFLAAPERLSTMHMMLDRGELVPGWGSSFVKGGPDPLWEEVDRMVGNSLSAITEHLHGRGLMLWPNGSAYTVLTSIETGVDPLQIFIQGRLAAWFEMLQ